MKQDDKPNVLCVDDEPNILEGLALNLRRHYRVMSATSGTLALDALRDTREPVAIVISDMRMPTMDGATFLARSRELAPDAVRILLTGQSDIDSAIAAINDGQIFRFLTKPCLPSTLIATLEAAMKQYELVTAERVLLEQTVHGSIQALTDVLALTNPALFGRAVRLKLLASELAMKLDVKDRWQIEVAAMLSQLGYIGLPPETLEKLQAGQRLSADEAAMVARAPALTEQLLANIPRLESVRTIISTIGRNIVRAETSDLSPALRRAMAIVRIAGDFDALDSQGIPPSLALEMLRSKTRYYDVAVINALEAIRGIARGSDEVLEIRLAGLKAGMLLAEDVRTENGMLIAAHGYQVTPGFVERAHNLRGRLGRTVRVIVRQRPAAAANPTRGDLETAVRI